MYHSITEALGTGSAMFLSVPPYLDKGHITVTIDGLPTTAFEWTNAQTVSVIAPANRLVRVVRRTSPDARLTAYLNGQALPGDTLEVDSKQAFFLAQEAMDAAVDALRALQGQATLGGMELTEAGILALLEGQITPSKLELALRSKIDLIDGAEDNPLSVAARIKVEAEARKAALIEEYQARVADISTETQNRIAAIAVETSAREDMGDTLAQQITTVAASTDAAHAAIQAEVTARTNADAAEATARQTVQSAVDGLTPRVAAVETASSTNASKISGVEANYTLKVQARSDGKFAIAGIGLNATANSAYAQSEMVFIADKFTFVPSMADINTVPQPLLVMGLVNGANTLVVPPQRLGDKLVEARMVVDGGIEARHMKVTGGAGGALNLDPGTSDYTAWMYGENVDPASIVVVNGPAGKTALRVAGGSSAPQRYSRLFPVTAGKQYRVSFTARRAAPGSGTDFVLLYFFDANDSVVGATITDMETGAPYNGIVFSAAWGNYRATAVAPSTAVRAQLGVIFGNAGTAIGDIQSFRCEEMLDYSLVVQGGIRADRIDTRGMTIKDAAGNVIFGAGTSLDWSRVSANPNWLNDNIKRPKNYLPSLARWAPGGAGNSISGNLSMAADGYFLSIPPGSVQNPALSPTLSIPSGAFMLSFWAYSTGGVDRNMYAGLTPADLPQALLTITPIPTLYKVPLNVPDVPSRLACNLRLFSEGASSSSSLIVYQPQLEVGTEYTPWKPANEDVPSVTNKISSENASSYLEAAAITNAYIGNVIQSNTFQTGVSGWRIAKDGNIEVNNLVARGDIWASAVYANAVHTAGLQGEAVNVWRTYENYADYQGSDNLAGPVVQTVFSIDVYIPQGGKVVVLWHAEQSFNGSSVFRAECYVNGLFAGYTRGGSDKQDSPNLMAFQSAVAGWNTISILWHADSTVKLLEQKLIVIGAQR